MFFSEKGYSPTSAMLQQILKLISAVEEEHSGSWHTFVSVYVRLTEATQLSFWNRQFHFCCPCIQRNEGEMRVRKESFTVLLPCSCNKILHRLLIFDMFPFML